MNPSDVSGFVLTNLCLLSQFSPRLHRQVSIFYCFHHTQFEMHLLERCYYSQTRAVVPLEESRS